MKQLPRTTIIFPLTALGLLVLLLLTLAPSADCQEALNNRTAGCSYFDKERPIFFVSYDQELTEEEANGKTPERILLRLHNNSTCTIKVEIGGGTDGGWHPVFYDIQKSGRGALKPANYYEERDLTVFHRVIPGDTQIIPIKAKYFKRRYIISIPFAYEWEKGGAHMVSHRVFFWYDAPKGY